ncbi:MAG: hypothetical protein AB7L92_08770, partial [Alphaproteobacteria bacterium]
MKYHTPIIFLTAFFALASVAQTPAYASDHSQRGCSFTCTAQEDDTRSLERQYRLCMRTVEVMCQTTTCDVITGTFRVQGYGTEITRYFPCIIGNYLVVY